MERADQRRVWAEIERYAAKAEASSFTSSCRAIYDKPEVKRHQEEMTHALGSTAPANTSGATVCANEGAAATTGTLRASAGAGQLFEFPLDRFRGAALVAEGQVVHATVL